jgi:hypothetical protein
MPGAAAIGAGDESNQAIRRMIRGRACRASAALPGDADDRAERAGTIAPRGFPQPCEKFRLAREPLSTWRL